MSMKEKAIRKLDKVLKRRNGERFLLLSKGGQNVLCYEGNGSQSGVFVPEKMLASIRNNVYNTMCTETRYNLDNEREEIRFINECEEIAIQIIKDCKFRWVNELPEDNGMEDV